MRYCPTRAAPRRRPSRTWPRTGTRGSGSSVARQANSARRCGRRTRRRWRRPASPADPVWQALDAAALAGQDLPVTAVFCASQALTRAALRALAARADGPSAERRVAVIGFGDFEGADVVSPPVTVVSYDPAGIGRTAGELLLRRLAGQRAAPSLVEMPVRLVARGSAEFPPSSGSLPW